MPAREAEARVTANVVALSVLSAADSMWEDLRSWAAG